MEVPRASALQVSSCTVRVRRSTRSARTEGFFEVVVLVVYLQRSPLSRSNVQSSAITRKKKSLVRNKLQKPSVTSLLTPYSSLLTPNLQQPPTYAPTSYIQTHKGHLPFTKISRAPNHLQQPPTSHFTSNQVSYYPQRAPKGTPNLFKTLNPRSSRFQRS